MRSETLTTLSAILRADDSIAPDHRAAIIEAASHPVKPPPPEPGTTRAAAAILGVHPVTLRRWARRGWVTPIRLGTRRVRYDLRQVRKLAYEGAPQTLPPDEPAAETPEK